MAIGIVNIENFKWRTRVIGNTVALQVPELSKSPFESPP
jgi:hypothetical protein